VRLRPSSWSGLAIATGTVADAIVAATARPFTLRADITTAVGLAGVLGIGLVRLRRGRQAASGGPALGGAVSGGAPGDIASGGTALGGQALGGAVSDSGGTAPGGTASGGAVSDSGGTAPGGPASGGAVSDSGGTAPGGTALGGTVMPALPGPLPRRAVVAWTTVAGAAAAFEIVNFVASPRSQHPTISSLLDALTGHEALRAVLFAAWIGAGVWLWGSS
jgi:hypothetical protein